jgi:hypothetical protein
MFSTKFRTTIATIGFQIASKPCEEEKGPGRAGRQKPRESGRFLGWS